MKINIVGGGPAGMYLALLLKRRMNGVHVVIHEQNSADVTYGWGVVFSDVGLSVIREADPEFFNEFIRHHVTCDFMEIVHKDSRVQVKGNYFSRTSRIEMLKVLQKSCAEAGVEIRYGERAVDVEKMRSESDVLVGADGINSVVRTHYNEFFKPEITKRRNQFVWYGTKQRFSAVSLIFRQSSYGVFIAHAYQYSKDLSTFLVEVSPETWQRAGLNSASETESRELCRQVFEKDLGSNVLLSNRSNWFQASIIKNANWSYENVVLMGDALRTVHFSLGSGTRMAMQDAIALASAIEKHGADIPSALQLYRSLRESSSTGFQQAADRSLEWYEHVEAKLDMTPTAFAYDYMMRTGQLTKEDLRRKDQDFVEACEAAEIV